MNIMRLTKNTIKVRPSLMILKSNTKALTAMMILRIMLLKIVMMIIMGM